MSTQSLQYSVSRRGFFMRDGSAQAPAWVPGRGFASPVRTHRSLATPRDHRARRRPQAGSRGHKSCAPGACLTWHRCLRGSSLSFGIRWLRTVCHILCVAASVRPARLFLRPCSPQPAVRAASGGLRWRAAGRRIALCFTRPRKLTGWPGCAPPPRRDSAGSAPDGLIIATQGAHRRGYPPLLATNGAREANTFPSEEGSLHSHRAKGRLPPVLRRRRPGGAAGGDDAGIRSRNYVKQTVMLSSCDILMLAH
jgi:hypothetical protein